MNPSNKWIDKETAEKIAMQELNSFILKTEPASEKYIKEGKLGSTILVERIDEPNNAYFLITLEISEGIIFLTEIDAKTEDLLGVIKYPKPIKSVFLKKHEALDLVSQKFPYYKFDEPKFVWKPCRESTSPIRPFLQINYQSGILYVDMDGSIYSDLTPLGKGG